jgi:hypothetical protein
MFTHITFFVDEENHDIAALEDLGGDDIALMFGARRELTVMLTPYDLEKLAWNINSFLLDRDVKGGRLDAA